MRQANKHDKKNPEAGNLTIAIAFTLDQTKKDSGSAR